MSTALWLWAPLILAGLFGLAGGAVVVRALFCDRRSGLRRCPGCWYDMSGVSGLKCPECGREAESAGALCRTRRRWGRAAAGLFLVLLAGAGVAAQRIPKQTWLNAVPTAGYIGVLPWIEGGSGMNELRKRVESGTMRQWEYRWLVRRCIAELGAATPDPAKKVHLMRLLGTIETNGRHDRLWRPYRPGVQVSKIDNDGAIRALVALLDDGDQGVRTEAERTIGHFGSDGSGAIPALVEHFGAGPGAAGKTVGLIAAFEGTDRTSTLFSVLRRVGSFPETQLDHRQFLSRLKGIGTDVPRAVPVFTSGLEDGDPALRFLCAWILASIAPDDPEVRRHLLLHSDDRDERVRFVVFRSALRDPMDEEQTRVIVRAMESRELDFQILQEVGSRGVNSVPVQDALRRLLAATTEPHLLGDVAVASVRSGGDPAEAGSRLLGSLKGASDLNATETLWALSLIGYRAPEVLDQISVFVGSHDVGTRAAASSACAALGGSQEMITQMTLAWGYSHLGYLPRWDDLSVPVLSAALEDKSNRSRETACRFLAEVGERASCTLPRLRELRRDTDQGVKDSADHAVKMIEWEMKHREAAVKLREERRASIPRDHPW